MTPEESLALLTEASYIDPTLLPAHDDDRVAAAHTWARAIADGITYQTARERMFDHFQQHGAGRRLTPADINGATGDTTPMYLVPQGQRPELPAAPDTAWGDTTPPGGPCPECGRHWIHDTSIDITGRPACTQAPGRVMAQ